MTFPVSLCMMARDEQANLSQCLSGLAELFADITLVDTGSTDRTREIAAQFGARLEALPQGQAEAAAVRARACQARTDHEAAHARPMA